MFLTYTHIPSSEQCLTHGGSSVNGHLFMNKLDHVMANFWGRSQLQCLELILKQKGENLESQGVARGDGVGRRSALSPQGDPSGDFSVSAVPRWLFLPHVFAGRCSHHG